MLQLFKKLILHYLCYHIHIFILYISFILHIKLIQGDKIKRIISERLNWNKFQTDPYGMFKESSSIMIGNDRYEGFAIDIIQEMSKMLGFNYTFEVQTDGIYGSFNNVTKKWNGMLGKIIAGVSR